MALDSDEVVVTGTGHVYRAPVGTAFPALTDTPGGDWVDLGYCTEDGAKFSFGRETNPVMAWQAYDPIRIVVTKVPKEVEFELLQWNQHTMGTALGGGEFSGSSGDFAYDPPDESFVDEFALLVTGHDGDFEYRFGFRKVMVSDPVEFSFVRQNPVSLPIHVQTLAAGVEKPFTFQTDDEAIGLLADASS